MRAMHRHAATQIEPAGDSEGATARLAPKPLLGSLVAGLIASACCGGTLLFASAGLGAFYSALGLARYIAQALTLGALSVVAINNFFFRLAAARSGSSAAVAGRLRRRMFLSAAIGLLAMLASFVLLTWLEHGVVRAARFMSNPAYARALIPGVPNGSLALALVCVVMALLLLWALPFPHLDAASVLRRIGQTAVVGTTAVLVAFVVASTVGLAPTIATGHSGGHRESAAGHRDQRSGPGHGDQIGGSGGHH